MEKGLVEPLPLFERKIMRQVAHRVIAGEYGNGCERYRRLKLAGFDPSRVQREVMILLKEQDKLKGGAQ